MTTIVEGVLNSSAGGARGNKGWDLVFHLMPWRVVGGDDAPVRPLRIEIPVTQKALEQWMERLPEQATVKVAVRRIEPANEAWSLAKGRLPVRRVKGSAALQAARAARQKPVVIRDAVLGKLVLERTYGWFKTKLRLRGQRCSLAITQSGATEERARDLRDIARARGVVERLDAAWPAIEKAIVRNKLGLYNNNWRDRRRVLTAQEFLARIRIESIVIAPRRTTLYFKDGGLFLGHAIEVRMSPRGAVTEVCLAG